MLCKPIVKHWHFQPIVLKFARVIHDENKSSAQRLPEKTQNPVLYVVQVLLLANLKSFSMLFSLLKHFKH